ncbi:MAG: hypothetical protein LBS62_03175 [Clostridiales bacterium]|jgi:hypothetical protein|nr:hypothetical protein [Clostridiales bacterium]
MVLNKEVTPPETEGGVEKIAFYPAINGIKVTEDAFKDYYQTLIGLSFDRDISGFEPSAPPDMTVIYKHSNGEPDTVTRYYDYNENFYAVRVNDEEVGFVTSKFSVNLMFESLDSLLTNGLAEN